jgi:hypothetical protein
MYCKALWEFTMIIDKALYKYVHYRYIIIFKSLGVGDILIFYEKYTCKVGYVWSR